LLTFDSTMGQFLRIVPNRANHEGVSSRFGAE
jgi:hypothetical protein